MDMLVHRQHVPGSDSSCYLYTNVPAYVEVLVEAGGSHRGFGIGRRTLRVDESSQFAIARRSFEPRFCMADESSYENCRGSLALEATSADSLALAISVVSLEDV